ncbi:hypothetical protein V2J09_003792 [Rumex salicifolius]
MADQDQQWLVQCLNATLDTNQQVRTFAEASLNQASLQPASVLLKQFIKKHWHEDDDCFEPPLISSVEKEVVRGILLSLLNNSHRKISTAISMAVASIANYDWPVDWPDFMPFMIKMLNDPTNIHGVHGALRCLALLSEDLDDQVMPTFVPALFPCLLSIVSAFQIYDKSLRGKALTVVYICTSMLCTMKGVYRSETTALMSTMIKPWMAQFAIIMQHPLESEEPDDWSLRMEVLKCLNQYVQNFPAVTEKEFMVIMGPLWQTFVSSLKVYEQSAIKGDEDSFGGRYDSDGSERSLESYVIQLLEFFLTLLGSRRFLKMTEQQVHSWSLDANQYVADEDDDNYSCRICGKLLLEQIVSSCGEAGVEAITSAATRRFNESQQEKTGGSKSWWTIREALLYALASLSEEIFQMELSGSSRFRLKTLIEHIMTEDIETGMHEYPFLYARLFSSMSKISFMIKHEVTQSFLSDAIKAIGMDVPPPVKVGACRALSQLLPGAKQELIQAHIINIFSSLVELLKQASEETLHLVFESLQAAIKAGGQATSAIEPILSPIILNAWASHVSDPFISVDALEVLEVRRLPYLNSYICQLHFPPD